MFTTGLGGIFNVLGKALVSLSNVLIAYCIIYFYPEIHEELNSPIGPLLVVFAFTYGIATLFMGMYTTTAAALLHCLFADVDICKQQDIDFLVGTNRPPEMKNIVKHLAKPRPAHKIAHSSDGSDAEDQN